MESLKKFRKTVKQDEKKQEKSVSSEVSYLRSSSSSLPLVRGSLALWCVCAYFLNLNVVEESFVCICVPNLIKLHAVQCMYVANCYKLVVASARPLPRGH